MKRVLFICAAILFIFGYPPQTAYAEYVLPYPSFMPGNKLYKVTRVIDRLKKPLFFGSIGRFKYHMALADKYLVEAKTLFEYKQYLLAVDALTRSDNEIVSATPFIGSGTKEGKDMTVFGRQLAEASDFHILILLEIKTKVPKSFEWRPEKSEATTLTLADRIEAAIAKRIAARDRWAQL